jgi:hypothetical protein
LRRIARRLGLDDPWLLGLVAAGLLLRVGATLWLDASMPPRGDEQDYLREAAAFRESGVLETGPDVRPPLYFLLIAGFDVLAEALGLRVSLLAKLAQCLAGAATALFVYRSARRFAGVRCARFATGFLMFDPTLIGYTHILWPETFLLLLVSVVFDAIAGLESAGRRRQALVGMVIGLALLLKPAVGIFTLVLAASWLFRLGPLRAAQLVLVVGGVAACVIAPWVIRNQLRYGPAVLLENQGPYNLWMGNDPSPPLEILREWHSLTPTEQSRVGVERGLDAIAGDPRAFAVNFVHRALNLWGLEYFVIRHATIGGYGPIDRSTLLMLFWLVQAAYAVQLVAAALGLRTTTREPTLRLLSVYAALSTAVVASLVVTTRWRVPFAFLIAIAAGTGIDLLLSRRLRRTDLAAALAALGVLTFSLTRPLFTTIATGNFERVSELDRWSWRFFRY